MSKPGLRSEWTPSGRFVSTCLLIAPDRESLTEMMEATFMEFPKEHYNTRVISQGPFWEIDPQTALSLSEYKDWPSAIVSRTREKLP